MKQLKILFRRFYNLMGVTAMVTIAACLSVYSVNYIFQSVMPGLILKSVRSTERLVWIVLLVIMMAGFNILSRFLQNKKDNILFLFRIKEIGNVQKACLEVTPSEIENGTGKNDIQQSMQAVCSGNDFGIEAYLMAVLNTFTLICTFILYIILLQKLPWWTYLVIFSGILIRIPYENAWQHTDEAELNKSYNERAVQEEFRRCTLQDDFAKDIRLFQGQEFAAQKLKQNTLFIVKYTQKREARRKRKAIVFNTLSLFRNIILVIFFSAQLDLFTAEDIAFYFGALLGIDSLTDSFMQNISELRNNKESLKNYCRLFSKYSKPAKKESKEAPSIIPCSLEFKNVSFSYPAHLIFNDISFKINQGEKIAVIGENGVGKTTLIKLILGVLQPEKGTVLINGKPLQEMDQPVYWDNITVSFQDSIILPFTLKENISGRTSAYTDEKRLREAVLKAGIQNMVDTLPAKENSFCTTDYDANGINFSGGQTQKIYMARMLYKKANIMLLDEPTASLDAKAESEIYEQYNIYSKGNICFFVSHRLSSTKFCDKILFIEDNNRVYLDSFQQLYMNNKKFRCMYDTQSKYYREEPYAPQPD